MNTQEVPEPRFAFGANWRSFARYGLTAERIEQARSDFLRLVPAAELKGRTFLDIGFGQGLSLALAAEAGAITYGVDIDAEALEALRITAPKIDPQWNPEVRIASILDADISSLFGIAQFDIVHAWGVLHHTGSMWRAIESSAALVKPGGLFICSLYNTHWSSPAWLFIKRTYNRLPASGQKLLIGLMCPVIAAAKFCVTGKNPFRKERGMAFYWDVVDWVGGYPYEYATVAEVRSRLSALGMSEEKIVPATVPTGCNEFVFRAARA